MADKEPLFPRDRKEVFLDLFKHHKWELEKANLRLLLFAAPSLLLVYVYSLFSGLLSYLVEKGLWSLPLIDGAPISQSLYLFEVRNVLFLILVFTNLLLFLGLGGFIGVVQKLAFMENVDGKADFYQGLKKNAKDYLLLSLFFSLGTYFFEFVVSYYSNDIANWASVVSIVIACALLFFILYIGFMALPFANLYKASFANVLKDSAILSFKEVGLNFLFFTVALLPLLLFLIPSTMATAVLEILMTFLYFPYFGLVMVLNANRIDDRYINQEGFPGLVSKGIKRR